MDNNLGDPAGTAFFVNTTRWELQEPLAGVVCIKTVFKNARTSGLKRCNYLVETSYLITSNWGLTDLLGQCCCRYSGYAGKF